MKSSHWNLHKHWCVASSGIFGQWNCPTVYVFTHVVKGWCGVCCCRTIWVRRLYTRLRGVEVLSAPVFLWPTELSFSKYTVDWHLMGYIKHLYPGPTCFIKGEVTRALCPWDPTLSFQMKPELAMIQMFLGTLDKRFSNKTSVAGWLS